MNYPVWHIVGTSTPFSPWHRFSYEPTKKSKLLCSIAMFLSLVFVVISSILNTKSILCICGLLLKSVLSHGVCPQTVFYICILVAHLWIRGIVHKTGVPQGAVVRASVLYNCNVLKTMVPKE